MECALLDGLLRIMNCFSSSKFKWVSGSGCDSLSVSNLVGFKGAVALVWSKHAIHARKMQKNVILDELDDQKSSPALLYRKKRMIFEIFCHLKNICLRDGNRRSDCTCGGIG